MRRLLAAFAAIAILAAADRAPQNRACPILASEGRSAQARIGGALLGYVRSESARPAYAEAELRLRLDKLEARGPAYVIPLEAGARQIRLDQLKGASRVALIWRSDCAPCLAELQHFDALEGAIGAGRLITIALESPEAAHAALARLNVKRHPAYAAAGDAQTFLETMSDGGRRLPLAVALDRNGRICARHVGLLGVERIRAWIAQC